MWNKVHRDIHRGAQGIVRPQTGCIKPYLKLGVAAGKASWRKQREEEVSAR